MHINKSYINTTSNVVTGSTALQQSSFSYGSTSACFMQRPNNTHLMHVNCISTCIKCKTNENHDCNDHERATSMMTRKHNIEAKRGNHENDSEAKRMILNCRTTTDMNHQQAEILKQRCNTNSKRITEKEAKTASKLNQVTLYQQKCVSQSHTDPHLVQDAIDQTSRDDENLTNPLLISGYCKPRIIRIVQ